MLTLRRLASPSPTLTPSPNPSPSSNSNPNPNPNPNPDAYFAQRAEELADRREEKEHRQRVKLEQVERIPNA